MQVTKPRGIRHVVRKNGLKWREAPAVNGRAGQCEGALDRRADGKESSGCQKLGHKSDAMFELGRRANR